MTDRAVIDSSAFLCWFKEEPGAANVAVHLWRGAFLCAVNLTEIVTKLTDGGMATEDIAEAVKLSHLTVVPFESDLAWRAGLLRAATRHLGLSLGDRACLALAAREGGVAVTCDRAWGQVAGIAVEIVR